MAQTLDHQTSSDPLAVRSFQAIGTTATVVVQEPGRAEAAERMLRDEIESIDLACSRFRPDSELGDGARPCRRGRAGELVALRRPRRLL